MENVRAEARRDICAALGVPPAIAGAWEAANFASSKEQRESLYEDTIIPRARYIAGVLNAEFVQAFDPNLEFEWVFEKLDIMQPDRLQEAERAYRLSLGGIVIPTALATELGYDESEAGEGPTQRRIIDEDAELEDNPAKSKFITAIGKWERKAINAHSSNKSAAVSFETDNIPGRVCSVIEEQLKKANSKNAIRNVFQPYKEIDV
jgi:hypothetical protein